MLRFLPSVLMTAQGNWSCLEQKRCKGFVFHQLFHGEPRSFLQCTDCLGHLHHPEFLTPSQIIVQVTDNLSKGSPNPGDKSQRDLYDHQVAAFNEAYGPGSHWIEERTA